MNTKRNLVLSYVAFWLGVAIYVSTMVYKESERGKYQWVQRAKPVLAADGSLAAGDRIGYPVKLKIEDPNLFLPGEFEPGTRYVNADLLEKLPVALKSSADLTSDTNPTRYFGALLGAIGFIGITHFSRKSPPQSKEAQRTR